MNKPTITLINEAGSHRTGGLRGLTPNQIAQLLGFAPNIDDDEDKVSHSWGFKIDGHVCGVWSYKGSELSGDWSTYGPADALRSVFGKHVL